MYHSQTSGRIRKFRNMFASILNAISCTPQDGSVIWRRLTGASEDLRAELSHETNIRDAEILRMADGDMAPD